MKKQKNLGTHVVALRDREGVGKLRDLHMSASSLSLCNTADESDSSNLAETEHKITTDSKESVLRVSRKIVCWYFRLLLLHPKLP